MDNERNEQPTPCPECGQPCAADFCCDGCRESWDAREGRDDGLDPTYLYLP